MDFTQEINRNSTLSSNNSSAVSLDSRQFDGDVIPEMQEKLKILNDVIVESVAENIALENEISSFLKEIGIELKSLPNDIKDGLNKVCDILKIEGLTDMDLSTLEIHMQQKELETKKKARDEAEFKMNYDIAFKKYKRMQEKLDSMKNSINSLERKIIQLNDEKNEESERLLILSKLETYRNKVAKMNEQLKDLNINDLHPDVIIKTSDICMEKLIELTELNKQLNKYAELPPNLLQAKAALESKKKELEKIEKMVVERLT
ncbi:uncharacterized protein LOC122502938 [Leptopilina heterotoma]|uniref:uncharacterized protein LOC122502938 n=1 Tax=Leptopilina heterotoma TaxID=63436 RepID=UPI001CA81CBD|nr:uncharacterized protein LOC122502938 [Leptopilina heterotoma]